MLSVGALGRRHGLSRTTLLYYDRLGLLRPSARSEAGYRLYTEADSARLGRICEYRKIGLSLQRIGELLDATAQEARRSEAMFSRLAELNREIDVLREQQQLLVTLLGRPELMARDRRVDKAAWVAMLRACGMDDAAMLRWHRLFEASSPEGHQDFLTALGIAPAQIRRIRRQARKPGADPSED